MATNYTPEQPIILGLNGPFATGKTVTAQRLAPSVRGANNGANISKHLGKGTQTFENEQIYWDHISFAIPLYEMATTRRMTEGEDTFDRMCYEIHKTLLDVFGGGPLYGAPAYTELVKMVQQVASLPFPLDGKPRKFLQTVGSLVRTHNENAFVQWMDKTVKMKLMFHRSENRAIEDEFGEIPFGVVIDDVRMHNEAEWVKSQTNGILIHLTGDEAELAERLYNRDGVWPDNEMFNHESEQQSATIPQDWFDVTIDTTGLTVAEQVHRIRQHVNYLMGFPYTELKENAIAQNSS